MLVARRYVIQGRVQGVGFRFFVEDAARREGVRGFVRNLPDGRVEAIGEGDAEAMSRFELAIRRGPLQARVEDVYTDIMEPSGRFAGFSITR
jgi:acylphosphatase